MHILQQEGEREFGRPPHVEGLMEVGGVLKGWHINDTCRYHRQIKDKAFAGATMEPPAGYGGSATRQGRSTPDERKRVWQLMHQGGGCAFDGTS